MFDIAALTMSCCSQTKKAKGNINNFSFINFLSERLKTLTNYKATFSLAQIPGSPNLSEVTKYA